MAEGIKFGDIKHSWPDGEYTIRFSYGAIDAIEKEFGEDWSERLRDLFVGKTKRDLEFVTSVTTDRSMDGVAEDSPPIVPLVNALYHAWQLAWHGAKQMPDPQEDQQAEKKFKRFLRSWRTPASSG